MFPGCTEGWTIADWVEEWVSLKWLTVNPTYGNTATAALMQTYMQTHVRWNTSRRTAMDASFHNSRASKRLLSAREDAF